MALLTTVCRLLITMFLFSLVQSREDEMKLACEDLEGVCLPSDVDSCLHEIDAPGCQANEICCKEDATGRMSKGVEPGSESGVKALAESGYICKSTKSCKKQGGVCIANFNGDQYCETSDPNLCLDDRCSCCINCTNQAIPKKCQRKYGGKCQLNCDSDRIPTGKCKGPCKCCGCKIKPSCSNKNGYCITKGAPCDGTILSEGCEGKNCLCCVPEPCMNTSSCQDLGGYCGKTCMPGEQAQDGLCEGTCTCCIQEPCYTSEFCNMLGGYCSSSCQIGETVQDGFCQDDRCLCCIPEPVICAYSGSCASIGGYCSSTCGIGEASYVGYCQDYNCLCCSADMV